jgi:hypothetical protein
MMYMYVWHICIIRNKRMQIRIVYVYVPAATFHIIL